MKPPNYLAEYRSAQRRYADGRKDAPLDEWMDELGKIKAAFKSSVAGMLTQSDTNDPEVWFSLGHAFDSGHGAERDVVHAEIWFRRAAECGHSRSMIRLGLLLSRHGRTPEEVAESVDWFRRAAELGNADGMTWLGFAYRDGRGVAADRRLAVDWFIKAYAAGSKRTADLAGRVLADSQSDHPEAVKWLRTAADEGHVDSFYNLALIHEDRTSPQYDPAEAFRCWSRVAERPSGGLRFTAMLTLARWCRDGIGTARDREEAKRWLDQLMALAPKDKANYRDAAKLRKAIDEELF